MLPTDLKNEIVSNLHAQKDVRRIGKTNAGYKQIAECRFSNAVYQYRLRIPNAMPHSRLKTLILTLLLIPLGFGLKYYHGPGATWCNLYGAGIVYVTFWCLCAYTIFHYPRHIPAIALWVFTITCTLELLQLWHHPILETIRSYRVGVWIIGNGFDWGDFPHYGVGTGLGWGLMRKIDVGEQS